MRFDIRYRTLSTYDDLVRESQNELRACPANDDQQQLISYRVITSPTSRVLSFSDYWGTRVDAFGVRTPHLMLEVTAEASVETRTRPLCAVAPRPDALLAPAFVEDHLEYRDRSPHCHWGDAVSAATVYAVDLAGPNVVSQVLAIHRYAGNALVYEPGSTEVGIDVEDVLGGGRGVCQDFAHLAVAMCRASSIPARYVSGYLHQPDQPVQEAGHAWAEALIEDLGWVTFDAANSTSTTEHYIRLAIGLDYLEAAPVRGSYHGASREKLSVSLRIESARQAQS